MTPAVEECARCAVPNASFTYRSALAASLALKSSPFFSSSQGHTLVHLSAQRKHMLWDTLGA